jgi:hypothetical protein
MFTENTHQQVEIAVGALAFASAGLRDVGGRAGVARALGCDGAR